MTFEMNFQGGLVDRVRAAHSYLLLVVAALTSGCLALPIPTVEHGQGLGEEEVVHLFQPGRTTRADVLLALGDPMPQWRAKDERFFYYSWLRQTGYTVIAPLPVFVPPMGFIGSRSPWAIPWTRHCVLGLEFTPDNRLKRYQYFRFHWDSSEDFEQDYIDWYASESGGEYIPKGIREWIGQSTKAVE